MENTDGVIDWFQNLTNKKHKRFLQFDICSYYSSITPELLEKALEWACMYVNITQQEKQIIMQSKKSFLYTGDTPWVKKGDVNFDNGMGSFDGAECCDVIGLFLLDQLTNRIKDLQIGIYRDDGLAVAKTTPRNLEKMRQQIVKIFGEFGLKITSTANLKVVQFLDVTLDLVNGVYKPYIKPGDRPLYVNSQSNHPPSILKNIPLAVNRRLCKISGNKEIFEAAVPLYQAELDRAGYKHKMEFKNPEIPKRKRNKRIIWFNPPYSIIAKTNVGKKFLNLLDKNFPRGSLLYPLINRYKVKLSYRCLPNMGAKISQHNARLLREPTATKGCNCRVPADCPVPGRCQTDNVIYRATVTANNCRPETYVGLTADPFKDRHANHKQDFKNITRKNATTLSGYIWKLKDEGKVPNVYFEIIGRAKPYSPVSGICNLCTAEKFEILFNATTYTLNSRQELFGHCRHKNCKLLIKPKRRRKPD